MHRKLLYQNNFTQDIIWVLVTVSESVIFSQDNLARRTKYSPRCTYLLLPLICHIVEIIRTTNIIIIILPINWYLLLLSCQYLWKMTTIPFLTCMLKSHYDGVVILYKEKEGQVEYLVQHFALEDPYFHVLFTKTIHWEIKGRQNVFKLTLLFLLLRHCSHWPHSEFQWTSIYSWSSHVRGGPDNHPFNLWITIIFILPHWKYHCQITINVIRLQIYGNMNPFLKEFLAPKMKPLPPIELKLPGVMLAPIKYSS